jgi:hypothetical protein
MKTRVKRGGVDTDDEYNTPTATPESDNMSDYTWDSWYDDRFTEDTDKETTSTPEYNNELDEGFLENNEDTETDENNQFDDEGDVLPEDIANNQGAAANEVYGANQTWGGKRRRKSNKRKSNKRKSRRVKRRKSNKRNKSRKVKRRKSNKKRYMRGGQPALTASSDYTNRNTNTYIYKM